MAKRSGAVHPVYELLPFDLEGFGPLAELALDMRSTWNHDTDQIWRELDSELWERTHNPWVVLQTVSRARLESRLADREFRRMVDRLTRLRAGEVAEAAWFQNAHPASPLTGVAYFSMEFMLSEALPIYSGGLGNVAGDQLKAASDLGVPVTGIGLLYQQGYFRQMIDRNGAQEALFPYNDPGQLPVAPLRDQDGEWLRLQVDLPGCSVWLRTWQVQVGRTRLLLLDSNDAANFPAHRGITSELYGGGPELRLRQEILLGIGGWRLFKALGLRPEVCHLNEGHSAFAVLERARDYMKETGIRFEDALAITRAGNLFTTHTAVAAGFDRFEPRLIAQYLEGYAREDLGLTLNQLMALGRRDPNDPSEPFNMAYLAIRGSGAVNGVSRLHATVSRGLFAPLFPRWPGREVPVGYVTNGVHMPSWDSPEADELWTDACGRQRWQGETERLAHDIRRIPDSRIWRFRMDASRRLVEYARERLSRDLAAGGASAEAVEEAGRLFDPGILTLGFARRFATYKRPNLLLHDPDRLLRILRNPDRPVQLVIAGKAHPEDQAGQALIQEWIRFIRRPEARPHVIFLSDYDMLLTENLVHGVDVWLNTPRRPWEACGTSGMKVLVNGGLNFSELDGWWAEAYTPEVGWALGDGREHDEDPAWDAAEAGALYDRLEREVIPEFYARGRDGVPAGWVARMRESMARLTPTFSANRAVREYTEKHYLHAAGALKERAAAGGAAGKEINAWRHALEEKWAALRFGEVGVDTKAGRHGFEVQVFCGDLDPDSLQVEVYAEPGEGGDGGSPFEMKRGRPVPDTPGGFVYSASVPASRPASDYTPRIIPHHEGVAVPLEAPLILWQR